MLVLWFQYFFTDTTTSIMVFIQKHFILAVYVAFAMSRLEYQPTSRAEHNFFIWRGANLLVEELGCTEAEIDISHSHTCMYKFVIAKPCP